MKNDFFKVLFDVPDIWTFQETEDVSQVVKMDNDREHKVFKVKFLSKRVLLYFSSIQGVQYSNTKWYMDTKLLLCFPIFNLNLIYL